MEILISLDRVEPPAGRVRLVAGHDLTCRGEEGEGVGFAGWLGLLRALYEAIGSRGERPAGQG